MGTERPGQSRADRARNTGLRAWISVVPFVVPWVVPALISLYVKYYVMQNRGFLLNARYLGRPETHSSTGFTGWEKLSFFRSDLVVALLLVPAALLLLNRYLPRRWSAPLMAVLSVILSVALYAQLRAVEEVGRYISLDMLLVALSWGWHEPGANLAYLSAVEFSVLLAAIVSIVGLSWWAARRGNAISTDAAVERRWRTGAYVAVFPLIALCVPAWLARVPATAYHKSVFARALGAFWQQGEVDTREFSSLPVAELPKRYRELAHAPAPRRDPRYFGKAKGSNVLFFVLETGAARFLPPDDTLEDFPNLRRLRDSSFIAARHYTTYPYTNRALFSIFSSWYPIDGLRKFQRQHPTAVIPGIMRTLSALGYDTVKYAPTRWYGEADEEMYQTLGFQRQISPDAAAPPTVPGLSDKPGWQQARVEQDRAALDLMERDLEQDLTAGRHFAAVFLPQIGHEPYPDSGESEKKDLVARARDVLAIQDRWLGELLALLERHHQSERTIIVFTGDHGVRTRLEDPSFTGGTIDEYSFHVPLLIYAPQALDHREQIPWITSHIDVQPTVLDLLGVEAGRLAEEGTPVWNPELAQRTTYLFALHTFGADGYYSDGKFCMWSEMTDSCYVNARAHFDATNIVPAGTPASLDVVRSIERMAALQQVWATQFARPESLRSAVGNAAAASSRF